MTSKNIQQNKVKSGDTLRLVLTCFCLFLLSLLFPKSLSGALFAQTVNIRGTIVDDEKEPVELALIHVEGSSAGTTSDLKGHFSFNCKSRDTLVVVFQMLGHETRKRVLNNPTDTVRLNIMLPKTGYQLAEVEKKEIRRQTSAMTDINIADTRHMGNASGGGVEQIIATQSGVSTHDELSNQYNVRGGSFDENSTYINGTEVFRPLLVRSGQQEGLSIINPDMVQSIGFSAGGFESRYGDKMSSVLDITYKKVERFEASASASLLGASGYVGVGNKKFSWTNAVRYKTMKNLLSSLDTKGEYEPKDFDYQSYLSWSPNKRWTIDLLGNISRNDYNFKPADRETKFGTQEITKDFKVYFDGQEKDQFHTYFGNAKLTRNIGTLDYVSLNFSAFQTREKETFDIQGEYWLDESGNEVNTLGIGTYMQHARNRLKATATTLGLSGRLHPVPSHDVRFGLLWKHEQIEETMREWEMRDSAKYSLPHNDNRLDLVYNLTSINSVSSNRIEFYTQDTWRKEYPEGELILNYGVRLSHWSFNNETLFSPRATISFVPKKNDNFVFRFSTGLYYQAPFYKEIKDTVTTNGNTHVELNKDIKSQKSVHFLLGGEYKFRVNSRPFKATAELYYKALSDINPYNIDNVRISYLGKNCASGYVTGLDLKIYGEFVPGTDSWVSMGIMKAEEKINGKWTPSPTDQRFNLGVFFSDYFPGTEKWKVSVKGHFASGLPFSAPHAAITDKPFHFPSYRRVDLGISYRLHKRGTVPTTSPVLDAIREAWIGLDAFNILGISNVNSYYWVTDINNRQYAVPNYLTGRTLNLRMMINF